MKILEKKIQYLKADPAAESIPGEKRLEMISRFEKEAAETRRQLDEMLAERQEV